MPHKICLVTFRYPPLRGGAASTAHKIASILGAAGFEVHVSVFPEKESESNLALTNPDPNVTVEWHRMTSAGGDPLSDVERGLHMYKILGKLDAAHAFDSFHGVFLPAAFPCLQIVKKKPRPVVATATGSDATLWPLDPFRRQVIEFVLKGATRVSAVSRDSLQRLNAIVEIGHKSTAIPHAIDLEEIGEPWVLEKATRGVVGTASQFYPVKQIPLLIEAYSKIPRDRRTKLLLIGDFPDPAEKERIEAALHRFNVADETERTGYVDRERLKQLLRTMNVFAQTSQYEGFSNALLEAAAIGLPIVTTRTGAVDELLEQGPQSLVTTQPDATSIAQAMTGILSSDDRATKLSQAARDAASHFSPDVESQGYIQLHLSKKMAAV